MLKKRRKRVKKELKAAWDAVRRMEKWIESTEMSCLSQPEFDHLVDIHQDIMIYVNSARIANDQSRDGSIKE